MVLLFYTISEVYTIFGMVSAQDSISENFTLNKTKLKIREKVIAKNNLLITAKKRVIHPFSFLANLSLTENT